MTENSRYLSNWTQQHQSTSNPSSLLPGQRSRILNLGISPLNTRTQSRLSTLGQVHEEGRQLLRNNFYQVINELSPIMNQNNVESSSLSLGSWLRRTQTPAEQQPTTSSTVNQTPSNSYIINVDEVNSNTVNTDEPTNYNHESANSNSNNSADNSDEGAANALRQTPGGQTVCLIQNYVPFVVILLGKSLYDHRAGILIFIGLLAAFIHANTILKREISKQGGRSLFKLLILFTNLLVCICLIYYVFQEQKLYKSLVFIPPYTQPLNWWDLLWIVGVTDFVLKLLTIQVKIIMACLPGWILPYSSRGKCYLLVESVSQLYRGLAPIQPWLYYLLESYQGAEKVIGVFMSASYMVSKGTDLMQKVKLFQRAVWKMIQNVSLGVSPSKEQLSSAGSQCPICHDEYNTPVLLHCRHVFCESCVTTWFDREQTCPLCRAKVVDDPSWRDGSTTMFVQLF